MRNQERNVAILCIVLGILCVYLSRVAEAREFRLIELKEASIGYKDFFPGGANPLINDVGSINTEPGKEINLYLNTDFAKFFYFNNHVHGMTEEIKESGGRGQFRTVGWEFALGVRASKYLNMEYMHHSQHELDAVRDGRFPVEDSIGIRLFLFRDDAPSAAIIK